MEKTEATTRLEFHHFSFSDCTMVVDVLPGFWSWLYSHLLTWESSVSVTPGISPGFNYLHANFYLSIATYLQPAIAYWTFFTLMFQRSETCHIPTWNSLFYNPSLVFFIKVLEYHHWQRFAPWPNYSGFSDFSMKLIFGLLCLSLHYSILARLLLSQFNQNPVSLLSDQVPHPPPSHLPRWCLITLACLQHEPC